MHLHIYIIYIYIYTHTSCIYTQKRSLYMFTLEPPSPMDHLSLTYVHFCVLSISVFFPSHPSQLIRADFCNFATLFLKYSKYQFCS